MDLLSIFAKTRRGFPSAASWVLSSELRLSAGFAYARQSLAFLVTSEQRPWRAMPVPDPGY
jgi:hypothetical protein